LIYALAKISATAISRMTLVNVLLIIAAMFSFVIEPIVLSVVL
jgi:hypothetical protein